MGRDHNANNGGIVILEQELVEPALIQDIEARIGSLQDARNITAATTGGASAEYTRRALMAIKHGNLERAEQYLDFVEAQHRGSDRRHIVDWRTPERQRSVSSWDSQVEKVLRQRFLPYDLIYKENKNADFVTAVDTRLYQLGILAEVAAYTTCEGRPARIIGRRTGRNLAYDVTDMTPDEHMHIAKRIREYANTLEATIRSDSILQEEIAPYEQQENYAPKHAESLNRIAAYLDRLEHLSEEDKKEAAAIARELRKSSETEPEKLAGEILRERRKHHQSDVKYPNLVIEEDQTIRDVDLEKIYLLQHPGHVHAHIAFDPALPISFNERLIQLTSTQLYDGSHIGDHAIHPLWYYLVRQAYVATVPKTLPYENWLPTKRERNAERIRHVREAAEHITELNYPSVRSLAKLQPHWFRDAVSSSCR